MFPQRLSENHALLPIQLRLEESCLPLGLELESPVEGGPLTIGIPPLPRPFGPEECGYRRHHDEQVFEVGIGVASLALKVAFPRPLLPVPQCHKDDPDACGSWHLIDCDRAITVSLPGVDGL